MHGRKKKRRGEGGVNYFESRWRRGGSSCRRRRWT
jgi:hypothetical protein